MVYEKIYFERQGFVYDLRFDDRITLLGGESGSGKTFLWKKLQEISNNNANSNISCYNYETKNLLNKIKSCHEKFIIIDNAEVLINDEIRKYINFDRSNQYLLISRNSDGLCVSDKSFKVLKMTDKIVSLVTEI